MGKLAVHGETASQPCQPVMERRSGAPLAAVHLLPLQHPGWQKNMAKPPTAHKTASNRCRASSRPNPRVASPQLHCLIGTSMCHCLGRNNSMTKRTRGAPQLIYMYGQDRPETNLPGRPRGSSGPSAPGVPQCSDGPLPLLHLLTPRVEHTALSIRRPKQHSRRTVYLCAP